MPLQSQEQETLNVKLVHFTKQNSPDEPVQVAFSVTSGEGGNHHGRISYTYYLFKLLQENNWLNIRRGVPSIRESGTQRRRNVGLGSRIYAYSVRRGLRLKQPFHCRPLLILRRCHSSQCRFRGGVYRLMTRNAAAMARQTG